MSSLKKILDHYKNQEFLIHHILKPMTIYYIILTNIINYFLIVNHVFSNKKQFVAAWSNG
jgi:hypothetical protein